MRVARVVRYLFAVVAAVFLLSVTALAGMIAFGASHTPVPLSDVEGPFKKMNFDDLPPVERFRARDGTELAYRVYAAQGNKAVVMLHGAAGSSFMLDALAKAAQASGFTAYVPDLRGHGASTPRGDVAYVGQLQDDLSDFARFLHRGQPGVSLSLVGHSAGGGLALRFAGGPNSAAFDRYVLVSPLLGRDAPTVRAGASGFAKPFKPRYVGLTILDRLGFHRFESLPVLAFAMPAARGGLLTPLYSYRLSENFTQNRHYLDDLRRITQPATVLVGANDELFDPDKFAPLIHGVRPDIAVNILPNVGHMGIVLMPTAIAHVIEALSR